MSYCWGGRALWFSEIHGALWCPGTSAVFYGHPNKITKPGPQQYCCYELAYIALNVIIGCGRQWISGYSRSGSVDITSYCFPNYMVSHDRVKISIACCVFLGILQVVIVMIHNMTLPKLQFPCTMKWCVLCFFRGGLRGTVVALDCWSTGPAIDPAPRA